MKKVRFETPTKLVMDSMQGYECQSPRPCIERQIVNFGCSASRSRPIVFTNDPVHRFDYDNSLPYPNANKTYLDTVKKLETKNVPSSDLDLSILDCSKPKSRVLSPKMNREVIIEPNGMTPINLTKNSPHERLEKHKCLTSIENNTKTGIHTSITRENEFFLKRENLSKIIFDPVPQQHNQFSINNINNPYKKKNDLMRLGTHTLSEKENCAPTGVQFNTDCNCHHCVKFVKHSPESGNRNVEHLYRHIPKLNCNVHNCVVSSTNCSCTCNMPIVQPTCNCNNSHSPLRSQNAIEKKTWAIEKYEKSQEDENSEMVKSNIVSKEKREPTVSDLYKIIKLQNEQLQLLQEKVDKFISTHNNEVQDNQKLPIENYVSEQLAVQTMNSEQHKISIGVMTSFEMVRTSTVINKEIVKQCEAQIQCNRSQISIKEIVSKKQSENLNFLEGISPVSKNIDQSKGGNAQACFNHNNYDGDNFIEDKTLNELSLYNVQVDNATTPLMSPEQSLYLDIRDYSESDSGDDQSNVGWTYYNKVMTHVNGMLQDSDMPSSASALYRHTKQRCMQIDKSNVSVGKRVTFGDDPLGIQQRYIATPTDTSLKMNQLAAKYLKHTSTSQTPTPKVTGEMSFATKNYMERHKLLRGQNTPIQDIPRFLDITALKQQPKFI